MPNIWGRVQTLLTGAALSRASSDAVGPVLTPVRQRAFSKNPYQVLDAGTVAQLIAEALLTADEGEGEVARAGVNANRLRALTLLAQTFPGLSDLNTLSNRGLLKKGQLKTALERHGYPEDWHDALIAILQAILSTSEVANAVQQGHLPNPDAPDGSGPILPNISPSVAPAEGAATPVAPDEQPPSHVPLTQIDLDPIAEAKGQGIDVDRLRVLANLAGLPPGAETVLAMWNRGLIDEETVDAGIREGHLKTKWGGAFKRMRWAVLSGQEYAEAHLRDWVTQDEMYKGGALTGHTKSQMDLFYKNRGRTATPRQLWLAVARKVQAPDYPDQPSNGRLTSFEDHEKAIRRSNIQPWYAPLLWKIRWNYPPLFQLNRLVQGGAIDGDTAALWASYNLEAPEVIEALKKYWATLQPATKRNPREALATTQAVATLKRRFLADLTDTEGALRGLELVGETVVAAGHIVEMWALEKGWTEKILTPAQVKKAYRGGTFTQDDAVAQLVERHYSAADALVYLTT